ncbi:hypothetical protein BDK61_2257 [Haloarcula quadrata]|uniref:Uncharacterized protein n=1 Tax=Haloarcula quadrata TaxID=182779 RepID=A0A495R6Q0_9EURY|nr:hypothetical protein [Haloarcula quadrata]RKS82932.1 hypothetical protein BDK61_2257 [Haloarcula quadrata]
MVANERGQLLLIGGVAIAIVVFSTILFAHSLAVTDGITTTGSADTIERSADREASVERDLGRLAAETRGDDLDEFEARYENALQNYTETHNRVVGGSGGAYLNATLNESASLGNETQQPSSKDIDDPNGGPKPKEWVVAKNVTRIAVFNFTFTKGHDSGKPFNITVEGADGNWWSLEVSLNGTSPKNKTITVRDSTPMSPTVACSAPNSGPGNTLEVDLVAGTCNKGSGFRTFSDVTKPPYDINVIKGQKAEGTYRFAAIGDFPGTSYDSVDPYPVVPAIDVTYDTPSASYNRTVLVEVENG